MGMVKPLGAGAADGAFAARLGDQVFPFLGGTSPEEILNSLLGLGAELGDVQGSIEVSKTLIVPGRDPGGFDELPEVLVAGATESHVLAVAALEDAAPQLLQRRYGRWSVVHSHSETPDGLEHAVKQGDFDSLPHAIALPGVQCDGDRHHRLKCPIDRRDGNGRVNRTRAIGVGRAESGRRRAHNPFVGRHGRPGIIRPEPGDGAVNQARLVSRNLFRSQPQPVHDAGPEVLDHHIGGQDEGPGNGNVLRALEVQRYAPLAPVPRRVGRRLPAGPAGRVNPHDVGALIGQQHTGQRPCDVLTEIDHPNVFQCS